MNKTLDTSVEARLNTLIASGDLIEDFAQISAARALDDLSSRLAQNPVKKAGLFSSRYLAPKGLYLWGGVGRGKSMLMDWFFEDVPISRKRRVHFHEFMLGVHSRIDTWRGLSDSEKKRSEHYTPKAEFSARLLGKVNDDPIAPTANAIAKEAALLCFDEFHVTDITDAMILSRVTVRPRTFI